MVSRREILGGLGRGLAVTGLVVGAGCNSSSGENAGPTHAQLVDVARADDGFLAVGSYSPTAENQYHWGIALDDSLSVRRQLAFEDVQDVSILGLEPLDGGALLWGHRDSTPWARAFDGSGEVRWTRQYDDYSSYTITGAAEIGRHVLFVGNARVDSSSGADSTAFDNGVDRKMAALRADIDGRITEAETLRFFGAIEAYGSFNDVVDHPDGPRVAGHHVYAGTDNSGARQRQNGWLVGYDVISDPVAIFSDDESTIRNVVRDDSGDGYVLVSVQKGMTVAHSTQMVHVVTEDGTEEWRESPTLGEVGDVAARPGGGVVAVGHYEESMIATPSESGTPSPPTGPWAQGFDETGESTWVNDPADSIVFAHSLLSRDDGRYLVTGFRERTDSERLDGWLAIMDETGSVRRSERYQPEDGTD